MIYIKRHNLVFIRVPKTASTSIAHHIINNLVCEDDLNLAWRVSYSKINNSHMTAKFAIDNNLVPANAHFIGVIREPLERLLSLYFARYGEGRYQEKLSVENFRIKASRGFIDDHPHQMRLQSNFLEAGDKWWLYDNLEHHIKLFNKKYNIDGALEKHNQSIVKYKTKDLIYKFYDTKTREAVLNYWQKDVELYERLKNESIDDLPESTNDDVSGH
jgi:hypothetical protein